MSLLDRWRNVGEMSSDVSRGFFGILGSSLRSFWRMPFMKKPALYNTQVTYELARSLYRNDNQAFCYGGAFVKPIIDLTVEYMGLPNVTSDDAERDAWLNECITDHWGSQIGEVFRDALRDSSAVIRFRQPNLKNPLFNEEDRMHGRIECVPPEMVDITYDPTDPDLVERAIFTHYVEFDERSADDVLNGTPPRIKTHELAEIVTAQQYRWFDRTDKRELVTWNQTNHWGFVPLWKVWNEYSADLGGGQSEIESVMPLIEAFHRVMYDTMTAHGYHSVPKTYFKLKDVGPFIQNNFPEAFDESTGKLRPGAKIDWKGREILFMSTDEESGFVEASSVLGDSKVLLDFLIECICVAAEVPRWALFKNDEALESSASVHTFEKKIGRKRISLGNPTIVMICKMALKAKSDDPVTVRTTWPAISVADLAAKAQALQQLIMSFDVAASHEWIADRTVVAILAAMFPEISAPEIEMALAKANKVIEPPAAPPSPTQGAHPEKAASSNGSGSKKAGQKAIATASASRS